jgi:phosphate transport system substrate-binding protein
MEGKMGSAAHTLTACASLIAAGVLWSGSAAAQEAIRIDGSTGVAPLATALVRAYQQKTPNVQVAIGKGLGTKARIDALQAGTIDIALASHGLKVDDLTRAGLVVTEIARTPVVFAVNSSVTIPSLTYDQVCAIYQGERTNWKEFGGPDLAIAPRTRPDTEVDAEVARDQVACLKSLKMPESVKIMQRGGDMAQELAATPGAFGMTTATVVEQSGGKVKALALGGITPDETNVTAGKYTLVREAFFVTKPSTRTPLRIS